LAANGLIVQSRNRSLDMSETQNSVITALQPAEFQTELIHEIRHGQSTPQMNLISNPRAFSDM